MGHLNQLASPKSQRLEIHFDTKVPFMLSSSSVILPMNFPIQRVEL